MSRPTIEQELPAELLTCLEDLTEDLTNLQELMVLLADSAPDLPRELPSLPIETAH